MRTSLARRAAASALALLVVAGTGVVRPAVAYAVGSALDPARCNEAADSNRQAGAVADAWHLTRLDPAAVWAVDDAAGVPITGAKIVVAVIDTAAQVNISPYLSGGTTKGAKPTWTMVDYVDDDDWKQTTQYQSGFGLDCAHGTRVVSLINAQALADGGSGFSGVAPGSSVIVMRALKNSSSPASESQIPTAKAIRAAADAGVDIINVSQAGSDDAALAEAVAYAIGRGVVVVASAGNDGSSGPRYPAAYPGVISVGMTTASDGPHPSSEAGAGVNVTIAAPGGDVVALLPSSPQLAATQTDKVFATTSQMWDTETGTSFAAPIVTGVVALMLQKAKADGVTLTPSEVKRRLEVTADPPPGAVPDAQLGYGLVNPMRAVFGPFPKKAASPAATAAASSTAGPLEIPAGRDTGVMVIAVVVTLAVLVLLLGALVLRAVLGPMRARSFAPARRDE